MSLKEHVNHLVIISTKQACKLLFCLNKKHKIHSDLTILEAL